MEPTTRAAISIIYTLVTSILIMISGGLHISSVSKSDKERGWKPPEKYSLKKEEDRDEEYDNHRAAVLKYAYLSLVLGFLSAFYALIATTGICCESLRPLIGYWFLNFFTLFGYAYVYFYLGFVKKLPHIVEPILGTVMIISTFIVLTIVFPVKEYIGTACEAESAMQNRRREIDRRLFQHANNSKNQTESARFNGSAQLWNVQQQNNFQESNSNQTQQQYFNQYDGREYHNAEKTVY